MRISDWSSDVCSSDLQATLGEMARSPGPGGFAVAASLAAEGGTVEIGTGTSAGAAERRQLRINGAAAALPSLGAWLSVLWLTPAMDRLFTEGASARRPFLARLTPAPAPRPPTPPPPPPPPLPAPHP